MHLTRTISLPPPPPRSLSEATNAIGGGGAITIRQVTSMNRTIETRERMKARYAFKNYPHSFEYRCKCLLVFQKIASHAA